MRRLILPSILVVAGLLSVVASQEAAAGPVITAAPLAVPAFTNGLLSEVYYYHGRYYPYHYKGHYYRHRNYRHGRYYYY